jgi:hypothetical protein
MASRPSLFRQYRVSDALTDNLEYSPIHARAAPSILQDPEAKRNNVSIGEEQRPGMRIPSSWKVKNNRLEGEEQRLGWRTESRKEKETFLDEEEQDT